MVADISRLLPPAQFAREPRSGETPVAHHSLCGDLKHLRRLFYAQPPKETQLDHLYPPRVDPPEFLERIVERAKGPCSGVRGSDLVEVQGRVLDAARPLHRASPPRVRAPRQRGCGA